MEIQVREIASLSVNASLVGELCAVECHSETVQAISIVAIYIRINQTITDVIDFIHKQLLAYTPLGLAALRKNYDKIPMILSGDFNVNFASNDSVLLVDFLRENLHLKTNNNLNEPMTRYGTTIDAILTDIPPYIRIQITFHSFQRSKVIILFLEDSDVHSPIDNQWKDLFITTHLQINKIFNTLRSIRVWAHSEKFALRYSILAFGYPFWFVHTYLRKHLLW